MTQIIEDYCSFEIAKLLKEKGFEGKMHTFYTEEGTEMESAYVVPSNFFPIYRPTLQMAMKWLREEKKLNCIIDVSFNQDRNGETEYYFCVWENKSPYELLRESPTFSIYEEACEAAIKYCLENLI